MTFLSSHSSCLLAVKNPQDSLVWEYIQQRPERVSQEFGAAPTGRDTRSNALERSFGYVAKGNVGVIKDEEEMGSNRPKVRLRQRSTLSKLKSRPMFSRATYSGQTW